MAGRPKGSLNKTTIETKERRKLFDRMVKKKYKDIIAVQIADALVDSRARHYLLDQYIGKPKEEVEVSGGVNLIIDF